MVYHSKALHDQYKNPWTDEPVQSKEKPRKVYRNWLNHRRPKLTSREKANDEFMNASRVVWLGVKLREEPLKIWTRYKA